MWLNTLFSDSNKSIDINHRNTESRLAKLKQIKELADKNRDRKIDNKELNDVFASLERDIFGADKLFSYEKIGWEYFATYLWVKLNIPIKNPERLIDVLNLLDKLIDDNIFKAWKNWKFSTKKDWASNVLKVQNTDRIFANTDLINDERLEGMVWDKKSLHQRWIHYWEILAEFLNEVQERMNSINHIDEVVKYQRILPKAEETGSNSQDRKIEKVQNDLTSWRAYAMGWGKKKKK